MAAHYKIMKKTFRRNVIFVLLQQDIRISKADINHNLHRVERYSLNPGLERPLNHSISYPNVQGLCVTLPRAAGIGHPYSESVIAENSRRSGNDSCIGVKRKTRRQ
jgi:hypothetical protein